MVDEQTKTEASEQEVVCEFSNENDRQEATEFEEAKEEKTEEKEKKRSGKAIAGFVLSIVGIFIAAFPCGVLGVVFSSMGLKDIFAGKYKAKGLAISGLVISVIDIAYGLLNFIP